MDWQKLLWWIGIVWLILLAAAALAVDVGAAILYVLKDSGCGEPMSKGNYMNSNPYYMEVLTSKESQEYTQRCRVRLKRRPVPVGQKFLPGERVRLIRHDHPTEGVLQLEGKMATVKYTYSHMYGGDDIKSYCLDFDHCGEVSWFQEEDIERVYTGKSYENV
jgi:hypothetical protein